MELTHSTKKKPDPLSIDEINVIANKVTYKFIHNRAIPHKEQEDFKQEIIHKYLMKKDKIESSFKGNSAYKTYITSVLYKMGCEIIRSEKKNWNLHEPDHHEYPYEGKSVNTEDGYIIQSEVELLDKIIDLFYTDKMKVYVFLKHYYQILILIEDLFEYHPEYKELSLDKLLLKIVDNNYEAFQNLARVVNIVEEKNIKPDAVRIWLYNKIDRMIHILNNMHQQSNYDRKSFQILFEFAYSSQN